MILLNFTHPLTAAHLERVEALAGKKVERVVAAQVQFDLERAFGEQVRELADRVELVTEELSGSRGYSGRPRAGIQAYGGGSRGGCTPGSISCLGDGPPDNHPDSFGNYVGVRRVHRGLGLPARWGWRRSRRCGGRARAPFQ